LFSWFFWRAKESYWKKGPGERQYDIFRQAVLRPEHAESARSWDILTGGGDTNNLMIMRASFAGRSLNHRTAVVPCPRHATRLRPLWASKRDKDDKIIDDSQFMEELSTMKYRYQKPTKAQRSSLEIGWKLSGAKVRMPHTNDVSTPAYQTLVFFESEHAM
jgi:hypothetical protein